MTKPDVLVVPPLCETSSVTSVKSVMPQVSGGVKVIRPPFLVSHQHCLTFLHPLSLAIIGNEQTPILLTPILLNGEENEHKMFISCLRNNGTII